MNTQDKQQDSPPTITITTDTTVILTTSQLLLLKDRQRAEAVLLELKYQFSRKTSRIEVK